MKSSAIIIVIIILLAAGALVYYLVNGGWGKLAETPGNSNGTNNPPDANSDIFSKGSEVWVRWREASLGLQFEFRQSPEGYVLLKPETGNEISTSTPRR